MHTTKWRWVLGLAAALAAAAAMWGCGGAGGGADPDADDDADAAEAGDTIGDAEVDAPDRADDAGDADVNPDCGNGRIDPGEECDEGPENNDVRPDACREDCRNPWCGDGVVDTGEGCDDGNDVDTDDCRNDCSSPTCGNGTVQPETGEQCDDGNRSNTDSCLNTCVDAVCGDGFVWEDNEECEGATTAVCTTGCGSAGARACVSCRFSADCTPPPEICNGLDEDCVGGPDDIFPCVAGVLVSCATTCGSAGTGRCTATCAIPTGDACTPLPEVCNGADDDCVDGCDNGFACCANAPTPCRTTCGSTGTGVCSALCAVPDASACTPPRETCNGLDDDCVDGCDNPFPCCAGMPVPCRTTCGSAGTGACSPSCGLPDVSACTPPREICNGLDDDCVDGCDNGFACCLLATRPCTVGTCTGIETCGSGCTWGSCDFGAPPANDNCSGALTPIPDTPGNYTYTGTTCAARNDFSWDCGGVPGASPDVVFQFTVTSGRRRLIVDTTGSGFDAMLFLRSGNPCPGAAVTCDDNSAGGGQARIVRDLDPGAYWIIVDGAFAGNRGNYVLNVAVINPAAPPNDLCPAAITLGIGPTLQRIDGDTTAAADDNAACAGSGGGRDVWYTFQLPMAHVIYLDTQDGRGWDSVIHIRSGACDGPLAAGGCADNSCRNSRSQFVGILPGGRYYVAVDGAAAAAFGQFTLRYQGSTCTAAADGNPATPAVIDPIGSDGTYTGTTVGQGNESTGTCVGGASRTAPDVYYYVGLCPARTVSLTTCAAATAFDTVLYVRQNQCMLTGPPDTVCNDDCPGSVVCPFPRTDYSCVQFGAGGQGLYFIWVDGYDTAAGAYGLVVNGL
ncbi:MAG: hypothetical protein QME96_04115 [Myxococcota bacterium]|nr:hypothetical protein [Myxococcota bacterium]